MFTTRIRVFNNALHYLKNIISTPNSVSLSMYARRHNISFVAYSPKLFVFILRLNQSIKKYSH